MIIFIHSGKDPHVQIAVEQARRFNPEVVLLSDGDFKPQEGLYKKFNESYIHLSKNPEWFEKIALARWFILLDYMKQQGIERCIHCDSDVMIYADLESEWQYFPHGLTISELKAGAVCFTKREVLGHFCEYILDCYTRGYRKLEDTFKRYIENGAEGGLCDMTFFSDFQGKYPDKIGIIKETLTGYYDGNINLSEGFNTDGEWSGKKIFGGGVPFGISNNKNIKMITLHFQGQAKRFMNNYRTAV